MIVRLQLFALAKQLAGAAILELDLPDEPPPTVLNVRTALAQRLPALASLSRHLVFAVNADYALDETPIPPHADVACIPPVSGG